MADGADKVDHYQTHASHRRSSELRKRSIRVHEILCTQPKV